MRRSGARGCDILSAPGALGVTLTAWPWYWRARQRDTVGTASGRSPGCRARPAAASVLQQLRVLATEAPLPIPQLPDGLLATGGSWGEPPGLGFCRGAGDGNRTRTISLGICAIGAVVRPDLRRGVSASDRDRPSGPVANGPLMARRPSPHCAPTLIVGQGRGADRFVNALR